MARLHPPRPVTTLGTLLALLVLLLGVDLHLTYSTLVNFTRANLVGVNFKDADLAGAILTDATFDRSTVWPYYGFDAVARGAIDLSD